MRFQKGNSLGGRKKGSKGVVTSQTREMFKLIIEGNLDNIDIWLQRIADKNPAQALTLLLKMSEFILPKGLLIEQNLNIDKKDDEMIITIVQNKDKNNLEDNGNGSNESIQ